MSDTCSPSGAGRFPGLLTLAAVLIASGAVGFITYRLLRPTGPSLHRIAPSEAAAGDVAPAELPSDLPAASPPRIPDKLPDIALSGADGKPHRLSDWAGRPLVVNFWATWCDPCRREIPLLKSIRREHAVNRLEIVGIAIDYPDAVRKYVSDHRIDYPVLLGEHGGLEAARAFGMETVLPFSVFIDRQGRVVTLKVGEIHQDEAEFILDRVQDVETGKLTLEAAQAEISTGVRRLREARAGAD